MDKDISSAFAFGALLRENSEAARIYDSCTPQQKQELLLQIQSIPIEGVASFVSQLSSV